MVKNIFTPEKGELLSDPEHFDHEAYLRVKKTYCGHHVLNDVRHIDKISAYDDSRIIKLPSYNGERFEWCHQCLADKTCLCPRTGKPIFIGDIISVKYAQGNKDKLEAYFREKKATAYPFMNPSMLPEFALLLSEANKIGEMLFEVVTYLDDEKHGNLWYNTGIYMMPGIAVPETRTLYRDMLVHDIRRNFLDIQ